MGGAGDFVLAVRLILIPIHVQDQISFLPCGHKKELRSVSLSFWEVLGSSEILWSLFDFKSNLFLFLGINRTKSLGFELEFYI